MSQREMPCPYRIIDDFGGGFAMGCFGGCILHFIRGMWYSPKKERLFGGVMLMKKRAPVLGGSFALWAGLFSSTECLLIHFRNKEDFYNPVIAGFVTGGLLAARAGMKVAFRNAVFGGIILGCIQLVEIGMIKYNIRQEMQQMHKMQQEEVERQKEYIKEIRPGIFIKRSLQKLKQERRSLTSYILKDLFFIYLFTLIKKSLFNDLKSIFIKIWFLYFYILYFFIHFLLFILINKVQMFGIELFSKFYIFLKHFC